MEVQQDFRDLLALFNAHKVDYIIVGAHALAYHGAPRYTGDMEFILNKRAIGRKKDLADLEAMGED